MKSHLLMFFMAIFLGCGQWGGGQAAKSKANSVPGGTEGGDIYRYEELLDLEEITGETYLGLVKSGDVIELKIQGSNFVSEMPVGLYGDDLSPWIEKNCRYSLPQDVTLLDFDGFSLKTQERTPSPREAKLFCPPGGVTEYCSLDSEKGISLCKRHALTFFNAKGVVDLAIKIGGKLYYIGDIVDFNPYHISTEFVIPEKRFFGPQEAYLVNISPQVGLTPSDVFSRHKEEEKEDLLPGQFEPYQRPEGPLQSMFFVDARRRYVPEDDL